MYVPCVVKQHQGLTLRATTEPQVKEPGGAFELGVLDKGADVHGTRDLDFKLFLPPQIRLGDAESKVEVRQQGLCGW